MGNVLQHWATTYSTKNTVFVINEDIGSKGPEKLYEMKFPTESANVGV